MQPEGPGPTADRASATAGFRVADGSSTAQPGLPAPFPSLGSASPSAKPRLPEGVRGVVVLGMGRSGTSLVTSMFHRSGYFVADDQDLMPPSEANPTGFFENLRVFQANEAVFDELQAAWFVPPSSAELASLDRSFVSKIERTFRALLDQAGQRPLALKDPRIGVLMPIWWPLLRGVLHPVLAVRHPVEIATSLERRDGTSLPAGLAMWESYFNALLSSLVGEALTIAPYEAIVKRPSVASKIVAEASNALETGLSSSLDYRRAEQAVDDSLWRNRVIADQRALWLTRGQASLWGWLAGLAPGTQYLTLDHVPEASEQAQLLVQYERCRQLELTEVRRSLGRAEQCAAEGESLRADLESRLSEAAERAHQLEAALQQAQSTISVVRSSRSWRLTKPLRGLRARLAGG